MNKVLHFDSVTSKRKINLEINHPLISGESEMNVL